MRRFARLIATLAILPMAGTAQAYVGRASFTLHGIVPVRCDAQINDVRISEGEAVILVDERCNTTHQISVFLDAASAADGPVRFAYNGQSANSPGGVAHFPGLGFSDQVSELRISFPGKSPQQVQEALSAFRFELTVLS